MGRFSERHGYSDSFPAITIREDAPHELRGVAIDIAYECGLDPHRARVIVSRTLRIREDTDNWPPFPEIDEEVRSNLDKCEWYEVYDIIEAFYHELVSLRNRDLAVQPNHFSAELNSYFRRRGIGWQLVDGKIQIRGDEVFELAVDGAVNILRSGNRSTAANELHQALLDLSRRPFPDLTGAIQHALASLECVVREVTGDRQATLGTLLRRHGDLVPKPLDIALEKLWGFASEQGRHLQEGRVPDLAEAELTVVMAAATSRYLARKFEGPATHHE